MKENKIQLKTSISTIEPPIAIVVRFGVYRKVQGCNA